ncbi:hypothetical protein HK099_000188 [Clydaea vesicula]|uniref:Tail specific protease domain-containing protein n=1 Tax=Clydaea vesicula TaxID=447962 RepID=A0AAD5U4E4_9FUNG|nr:hypothetical protein HK099_000188 [Clydaea vesicula]
MLFKTVAAITLSLTALVSSQVSTVEFAPFSQYKDLAKFPKLSANERSSLLTQVNKLLTVYVNRESKIDNYGYDVLKSLEEINAKAANSTEKELFTSLANAINGNRDGHTALVLPAPHSCFAKIFPLTWSLIETDDPKNPIAVVKDFTSFPEVKKVAGPALDRVKPGHVLVSINGLTINQLYEKYSATTRGANYFGGVRSILSGTFGIRGGRLYPVQFSDNERTDVTYVLKERPDSKNTYEITVPTVGRKNNACLATAPVSNIANNEKPTFPKYPIMKAADPEFYLDTYGGTSELPLTSVEGTGGILLYGKYKYLGTNLGVLRLTQFSPVTTGSTLRPETVVKAIRDVLVNQFKDTDALVLDLRSNPGGWVYLADAIPQFFKPDYTPATARFLMAPLNDKIPGAGIEGADAFNAYSSTPAGQKYSNHYRMTSPSAANFYGQAYLKPVAVFNDGNCYSACDLLSAGLQDHQAIKKMYGADLNTGAGGASVVGINNFFKLASPSDFPGLPKGMDFSIGYRQLVRNGVNDGKLIEDLGISVDKFIRPTLSDMFNVNNRSSIFDTIAHELRAIGQADGINAEPQVETSLAFGEKISFKTTSGYITKLELTLNDKVVDSKDFVLRKTTQDSTLEAVASENGLFHYQILGYTNDKRVLKTSRYVKTTPNVNNYLKLQAGTPVAWDFKHAGWTGAYDTLTTTAKWNLLNGKFVVGDGLNYPDDVDTSVSFFLNAQGKVKVQLNLESESEQDYDFVTLTYTPAGGAPKTLFKVSGSQKFDKEFVFDSTANGELNLKFTSDGGVSAPGGVKVNAISFSL